MLFSFGFLESSKISSIVGYGRFGKTLHRLLKGDFEIRIYDTSPVSIEIDDKNSKILKNLEEVYKSEVIFFAIPIAKFERVIKEHKKYFKDQLLVDVLSVKMHPKKVFDKHTIGKSLEIMLTHPMFGPDSSKNGFENLPIVIDKYKASKENLAFWKKYFARKGLTVVEMKAREHDKLAANSQGVTHFIGRLLEKLKFEPTNIDTAGTKRLHEVSENTVNDSWELFDNLQTFNPHTKSMRRKLGAAYDSIYNKLLPKNAEKRKVTIGIQGGEGSFNEEAVQEFIKAAKIKNAEVKYLFTSEKVLKNLHEGSIDLGQFAIQNSTGGMVLESIEAMAKYKVQIVKQFSIPIKHFLHKHKKAKLEEITTIMSHPQAIKQCRETLDKKYPHLEITSGEGELIDHAKVAEYVSKGKLPKSIAILGSKILSDIYGLEVIDKNLQDDSTNYTDFLIVSRPD